MAGSDHYVAQTNFSGGEWSDNLSGRVDLPQHDNAVASLVNWRVLPQGGILTTPGSIRAATVKDSTKTTFLHDFEFNDEQTYQLEIGDLYMRFYTDSQRLESASTVITNCADNGAGLIRVTSVAHGLLTNDYTAIKSVLGTNEANGDWKVTRIDADNFDLQGSTFATAYTSGGTSSKINEITTIYAHGDVPDLQFAQSADTMFIFHRDYRPQKVTRTAATTFTITDANFIHGPFEDTNDTATQVRFLRTPKEIVNCLNNAGLVEVYTAIDHDWNTGDTVFIYGVLGTTEANGAWTITSTSATSFTLNTSAYANAYVSGGRVGATNSATAIGTLGEVYASASTFVADDVYSEFQLGGTVAVDGENVPGSVRLTGYVSAQTMECTIVSTLSAATATTTWAFGRWNVTDGWPTAGTFYDNRLVVGRDDEFWGSRTGQYVNMDMEATTDDYAYSWRLNSKKASLIRWLASDSDLFIGTSGREYRVIGNNDSGITPTSIQVKPASTHGSKAMECLETAGGILFVQRGVGTKLRKITYSVERDKYISPDQTIMADEVLTGGAVQMCYEPEPNETIWVVRTDGTLCCFTMLDEHKIMAWSRRTTDGLFKSVSSSSISTGQRTWAIVQRTINGATKKFVEYFDPTILVDCAITTTFGSAVTTITGGLDYLEGETVIIIGDGAVSTSQVVTDGALPEALDFAATTVTIGLAMPTPTCTFFLPEKELPDGRSTGRNLRVARVVLKVKDAIGLAVNGENNPTFSTADDMDTAPATETDLILFVPDLGWNVPVEITQPLPFPATVLGAYQFVQIGDQ